MRQLLYFVSSKGVLSWINFCLLNWFGKQNASLTNDASSPMNVGHSRVFNGLLLFVMPLTFVVAFMISTMVWSCWFLVAGMFCIWMWHTVYPKKYAHGFCFAVLCCGYTLTDFPISIRLTSLALWQSNDCPSASKATLINMDKYFMWNHYERLHNHNKSKHNKTVCIFLGIYCI